MFGGYFIHRGIKIRLSVKFYISDTSLLRTMYQFIKTMFEIQCVSNNCLSFVQNSQLLWACHFNFLL